ncbi:oligosaccharide flippase family protein [Mesorhizobium sp. CAU 1732]|uniref:oligosaccharide flippase family protein n=1 Tax=Mesorhizobium sp. CAU 1732 TaxID=3140358 RepID=UPI00325FFA08
MLVFLGSRVTSAILNLAAVAIFTRLGGVETYGIYLLVLAWAFVFHSLLTSWINEAFFARYREDAFDSYMSTALAMMVVSLIVASLPVAVLVAQGYLTPSLALALGLTTTGLAAYDFSVQASRTRMHVLLSGTTTMLRAVLIVVAGSVALTTFHDPVALPIAVALAHLGAAIPMFVSYRAHLFKFFNREMALELFRYGWPLMLAGATWAFAQNIDRIALGHYHGSASVGPYGAMADFLKQGFFVFGEVVVLSLVTVAKRAVTEGRMTDARSALREAMRSIAVITVFGSLLVLALQDTIVTVFFGEQFHATARDLLPLLLVASSILVFRTYYFGQVVYFLPSGMVQFYAAALQLLVTATLVFALVPVYREHGAAIALIAGQCASCALVALWRSADFRMPVPALDIAKIAAVGAVVWMLHLAVDRVVADELMRLLANITLIVGSGTIILWHYDLFAMRLAMRHVIAFAR